MGLTVIRRLGETIRLDIKPGTTPQQLWDSLQDGLVIRLVDSCNRRAQLDITAPKTVGILRPEQHGQSPDE